jgi:hypothetical protein
MKSFSIADGDVFRKSVENHSGAEWTMTSRLARETGILAGRDGVGSRGIYCEQCRFGFRREFGPYPITEARTSLAHDFTDEAHRRDCPHWKAFVAHPQAFSAARTVSVACSPATPAGPATNPHVCERCSAETKALFRCLNSRVCFQCLGEVLSLTGGFRGLKSLMTVEAAPDPKPRALRRDPNFGRCRTCRAFGRVIAIHGYKYCRPCATARVEKLLAGR